jgi:hypothetical protein
VFWLFASGRRGGVSIEATELRFTLSYDLWEERFAVSRNGVNSKAISHLTVREAEDSCLESLWLSTGTLSQAPFWIRLECRVEEPDSGADEEGDSLFTLGGLIDTLSRRSSREQPNGSLEVGPFRMADLR